jgi:hypothetical protein
MNTNADSPGKPDKLKSGFSTSDNQPITPKYCITVTVNETITVNLIIHQAVFKAGGIADFTAIIVRVFILISQ